MNNNLAEKIQLPESGATEEPKVTTMLPTPKIGTPLDLQVLQKAMINLLRAEPFFGYFLSRAKKVFTTSIPTCAVTVREHVLLLINPLFFNTLDLDMQTRILKHEVLHLMCEHLFRGKDYDPKLFNIAADVAINQLIAGMPDSMMIDGKECFFATLKNLQQSFPKANIQANQTSDYYYKFLVQEQEKQKGKGKGDATSGMRSVDDHGPWSDCIDKSVAKEVVKELTNSAKNHAEKQANYGNLPADLLRIINALNKPQVNWKQQLHSFISNSEEILIELSRKRRNRRFGIFQPADKVYSKLKIALVLDTSGSTQSILEKFLAEMNGIHKQGAIIEVIQCDTEVHGKPEKYDPKRKFKMKGGGGTDMNPGIEAANALHPDAIICLTDGYIPPCDVKPRARFLWVVCANESFPVPFGKKVDIRAE